MWSGTTPLDVRGLVRTRTSTAIWLRPAPLRDPRFVADVNVGKLARYLRLLARKVITHGLYVHTVDPVEQVVEVVRRLDLAPRITPFTRCLRCNSPVVEVTKSEVLDRLEPLTHRYFDDFRRCTGCGRIFWAGSHHARLVALVDTIRTRVCARA